jgi:hypothetical protein
LTGCKDGPGAAVSGPEAGSLSLNAAMALTERFSAAAESIDQGKLEGTDEIQESRAIGLQGGF